LYLEPLETNVFIVVAILLNISFVFFMSFWSVWKNSNSSQIATRAERVGVCLKVSVKDLTLLVMLFYWEGSVKLFP